MRAASVAAASLSCTRTADRSARRRCSKSTRTASGSGRPGPSAARSISLMPIGLAGCAAPGCSFRCTTETGARGSPSGRSSSSSTSTVFSFGPLSASDFMLFSSRLGLGGKSTSLGSKLKPVRLFHAKAVSALSATGRS